jgi:hypothetical protein
MKLLDEIVDLAIDNQASISVLLRKCLVLAHQLKNDRLRSWVENELNGLQGLIFKHPSKGTEEETLCGSVDFSIFGKLGIRSGIC